MSGPPFLLQLMGSVSLRSGDGEEVDLSRGKPMALLAVLALESPPLSRDELAELLWSESSRARARGSLRQALWQIRSALGDDILAGDDPVLLSTNRVETDIGRLDRHLSAGRLLQAVEAWKGAPFADLRVGGAREWERWAENRRRDVERRLGEALSERGHEERRRGSTKEATTWLRRATEVQPYRLQHHLDLADAFLETRAFSEAQGVITTAKGVFDDESSLEALDQIGRRVDQLERGTPIEPSTIPGSGTVRLRFTGRSREFAALARRWSQARDGEASLGLILGEAGIGKTRLAEEVAYLATSEGGRVVQVKADDSERPIEWALLVELVRGLLPLSGSAGISAGTQQVLRSLLPSLPRTSPPGDGRPVAPPSLALSRTRPSAALSDALQDLVAAVAEDAPLIVIVDDLQWADGESRAVLTRAATRITRTPVLFLITSRAEGVDVSPRIGKTLNILARSDRSVRLDLEPLTEKETRTLLERTLRSDDGKALRRVVDNIIRASRGNPLFVLELLKILRDEGIVTGSDEGEWTIHPDRVPQEMPLPASLRELMDRQLDQLSQSASLVAAYLARSRYSVAPRVIAARSGLRPDELTEGVGELLQRRIIQWDASEKLAFAHDELRAAVSRRYQLHVGLTTGGGTTWSLYRTAVVVSLILLGMGAGLYALQGGALSSAPAMGGGSIFLVGQDGSAMEIRAAVTNPQAGWVVRDSDETLSLPVAQGSGPGVGSFMEPEEGSEGTSPTPHRIEAPSGARLLEVRAEGGGNVVGRVLNGRSLEVDRREWSAFHGAAWCEGSPGRLLVSVTGGSGPVLAIWEPDHGQFREMDLPGTPGSLLACSPDGRYMAAVVAEDGEMRLHVSDLSTGRVHPVSTPPPFHLREIHWVAERPRPRPETVVVEGEPNLQLDWGEKAWVQARVDRSDGSSLQRGIDWFSLNPAVASVTPEGRVSANRPGEAVLVASYEHWLTDSIQVTVRGVERPRGVLLHAPYPLSAPGVTGTLPELEFVQTTQIPGSPFGPDGEETVLRSLQGHALMTGGTLEAEIPSLGSEVTLGLCLTRGVPPLLASGGNSAEGVVQDDLPGPLPIGLCARLRRDTDGFTLRLGFHPAFPPLEWKGNPAGPDSGHAVETWSPGAVHLALSLLPDGTGVVFVNRTEVARTPIRLPMDTSEVWHPAIRTYGGPGSTRTIEVRDLILWDDLRF